MKKKGNPKRQKKPKKRTRHAVTYRYGVIPRYLHYCAACREQGIHNKKQLTVHHIKPQSIGGKNYLKNLMVLCITHHTEYHAKGFKETKEIINKIVERRNPNNFKLQPLT